jgi:hypothetical protein
MKEKLNYVFFRGLGRGEGDIFVKFQVLYFYGLEVKGEW